MSDALQGGDEGGVVPYAPGGDQYTEYSSSSGGSKRRKRGKRNSKKNSRRRSKKYMKKMYRGGSDDAPEEPKSDVSSVGGRRKNKKTRKGKVSKWITHVKNFSKANKMDFRDALKDPKCKSSYHKMK